MIEIRVELTVSPALEALVERLLAAVLTRATVDTSVGAAADADMPRETVETASPAASFAMTCNGAVSQPAGQPPVPADALLPRHPWLTERRALVLDAGWPAGRQTRDLRAELEALPGPPLPGNGVIATMACNRGLRRPDWFRPHYNRSVSAEPPEDKPPRQLVWSEERKDVLRRDYPAGVKLRDIVDACNSLPGRLVSPESAGAMAVSVLGLRRPAAPQPPAPAADPEPDDLPDSTNDRVEIIRNTARPADLVASRPPPPTLAPGVNAGRVHLRERDGSLSPALQMQAQSDADLAADPITFADALVWARRNGCVVTGEGLPPLRMLALINQHRATMHLPPWRLMAPKLVQEDLPDPSLTVAA